MKKISQAKNSKPYLLVTGIVLIILASILICQFFIRGRIVISGNFPEDESSESISCERKNTGYFLFNDPRILSDYTKLTLIFRNSKLDIASIVYIATTHDDVVAQNIEAIMMSELNTSFGSEFGFNGLGANFSSNNNTSRMSLTANISEIGISGKKYFLIDEIPNQKGSYQSELTKRGFECKIINSKE